MANQTPNLVMRIRIPSKQTVDNWINDARRFAQAAASGTRTAIWAYNNLKGPGIFQLNMAVSRTFAIRERQSIQLRAEAFNLPNHLNPFTPGVAAQCGPRGGNVALNSPNFGQITSDISGNSGLTVRRLSRHPIRNEIRLLIGCQPPEHRDTGKRRAKNPDGSFFCVLASVV